mgnify:CR=1 FL=1
MVTNYLNHSTPDSVYKEELFSSSDLVLKVNLPEMNVKLEKHEADLMKTMGTYAPAFGMVGTLIGLVFMLFGMAASDSDAGMGNIGESMGVALITTFYGTILANLIFNPFAEKIKSRNKENVQAFQLMIEGLCLLHQKKHPLDVKDKLTSFIPAEDRMKYFKDEN